VHLNRKVTITDGNEIVEGIFSGLGAHGEAIVSGKSVFNGSLRWID
jgi:biotin-(acetyl-CoA carboxylase) ligase